MPKMHRVSLKMPEPHIATLGTYNVTRAIAGTILGYWVAKVRNNAQIPEKEIAAKMTEVGR